jgi:hypothetical protein
MALDAQGRLHVNRANGTVWHRSADGQTFALFATMPGASSDFYLLDLAANATHLYGARFGSKTIYRTALSNGVVSTLSGPAAANRFDGVRIGPDGRLYGVDSDNGRIYAYDLNAASWSAFLTNAVAGDASQLEFGADGRVFVSRTVGGQARIYSYTLHTPGNYAAGLDPASETLVGAYGSSGAATGIRIGPDGRLYANAFNAGEIWRSNAGITAMESAAFVSGLNEPGSIFFPDAGPAPGAPFALSATALANAVMLRWSDPQASGATSAVVLVRAATNTYPAATNDGVAVYTGSARSFLHTNLVPNQTYYYAAWISHDGETFFDPP